MSVALRVRAGARRTRWSSAAAALLTSLAVLTGVMSAPAHAAPATVRLYGDVLDESFGPVSGATAEYFGQDPRTAPGATPIATAVSEGARFSAELTLDDQQPTSVWVRLSKAGLTTEVYGPYSARGGDEPMFLDEFVLAVDRTAVVSGTVADQRGTPIRGVTVSAYNGLEPLALARTETDARGRYTLRVPEAGSYAIQFDDPLREYATRWFANGSSFETATAVVLTEHQVRTGVDMTLGASTQPPPAFAVSGSVVDIRGVGQRGGSVVAWRRNGDDWVREGTAAVRSSGLVGFADLPAGQYAFQATGEGDVSDPGFESRWFGGSFTRADARVVTVGAGGPVSLGTLVVTRMGTVSGTLTVPALAGFPDAERTVTVVDADGETVARPDVAPSGAFAVVVRPGTYTVRFSGARLTAAPVRRAEYIPQWWKGGHSADRATAVTVADGGAVRGIDATLGRTLAPVVVPRLLGRALVGRALTVAPGTWNRRADVLFAYQWKVGGVTVGSGASYRLPASARGKKVSVAVTARSTFGTYLPGTATTPAVTAQEVAKIASFTAKGGRKRARVKVALRLPGTAASRTSGVVRIYDGSTLVGTVNVRRGTGARTVKLSKGRHRLTARYAGTAAYTSASASRTVRAR